MDRLVALLAFAFVSTVTPGPNNVLLWASGAAFGMRRTWPHVLGTALGVGGMAILVSAGVGALVTTVPGLALVMKVAGSIYLLYLAWQVAGAAALRRTSTARPMSVLRAIGFQLVNPKVWIVAVGAVTTFRPPDLPIALGSALVTVAMMAMTIPTALLWVVAGDVINRFIERPAARRAVSLVLALLVVATVVLVWA
jgi:threonine/homoserine/homoserine lactone efflux protein